MANLLSCHALSEKVTKQILLVESKLPDNDENDSSDSESNSNCQEFFRVFVQTVWRKDRTAN